MPLKFQNSLAILIRTMGLFVISKRFDERYKFVFTSRKGKTIFTSPSFELKMECEEKIDFIKANIDTINYLKTKSANGKFIFKMMFGDELIATSRKFSTLLLLEKSILEITQAIQKSEILDFTTNELVF